MDDVKSVIVKQMNERNEALQKTLEQANLEMINDYPEAAFIEYFLPMFAGEAVQDIALLRQWEQISGDLTRPVRLLDRAGNEKAIVPPVRSSMVFNFRAPASRSISADAKLVDLGVIQDPSSHIYVSGIMRLSEMKKAGHDDGLPQKWLDFLALYGKSPARIADADVDDVGFEY
jgi:hypothetical protein